MSILGDTAELAILLKLKDEVTGPLKSIDSQLGGLNAKSATVAGGLSKIGQGLATGLKTTAVLATAAIGVLAGLEGKGLQSLEQQQTLEAQTAAAIKSTGAAAGVSATQVAAWARSLGDANAVDELAVQHVENLLLTFRHIQNDTFPQATQAVLDMSQALGTDAASSAIQLGKALDNPTLGLTALRRVGVSFSDVQVAQIKGFMKTNDVLSAQNIILAEINKEFGGSGSAFSQTTAGKIALVRDRFDELTRTLAQASLPAVTALADGLNELMASPEVIAGAQALGQAIAGIFSPSNIHAGLDFVKSILPPLESGLKLTVQAAKVAFDLFNSLPPELKTVAIAALVGNKLTGGLVASGIGDVAKALMGGALGGGGLLGRGSTPANPLFVSDISGGGGLGGAAKNALGGGALAAGLTVAAGAAVAGVAVDQYMQTSNQASGIANQTATFVKTATLDQLKAARQAVVDGSKQVLNQSWFNPFAAAAEGGLTDSLKSLNAAIDARTTELNNAFRGGERGDITRASTISTSTATASPDAIAKVFRMGERGDVLSPAYEGIMSRATERGSKPTISAIEKTFAHWGTQQAAFRAGERGDLAAIRNAVDNVGSIIDSKMFGTTVYQTYRQGERDALPVTVNVSVSARSNETAAATANAYGPSASRAGAQGAPTRRGGI